MIRVKSSTARQGPEKKLSSIFRQLRLTATDVILCYGSNRSCLREDIRHADHVCELSEEYAFRAICLWLVTTYGSSAYSASIQSDLECVANNLSEALTTSGEYPFANDLPDQTFKGFYESTLALLDGCLPQIELLGSLYEHIHKFPLYIDVEGNFDIPTHIQQKDKRRLAGQFYTPPQIVDYCFERAVGAEEDKFIIALKSFAQHHGDPLAELENGLPSVSLNILDPSCGTGNFLLGAIRLIRRHSLSGNHKLLISTIGACLYGLEIDGRAASLARVSIMLALVDSWLELEAAARKSHMLRLLDNLRLHIKNVDTLYAAPEESDSNADEWFSRPTQFMLVITNPPYLSFGARNQPKLIDSATAYFRRKYPNSAEYKIRIHSIFQEIALRFASIEGTATLLIPDGFLTGGYYKKLRQMLLAKSRLHSFAELPSDTVPGAVVGRWCVASYKRTAVNEIDYSVKLYSHLEGESLLYSLPKSALVSRDQSRFRLVFNSIDEKLCGLIDSLSPLSTEFQGRTGIRALSGQSSIVASEPLGVNWRRGIKSGSSVQPHVVTWNGVWLHVDGSLLYKGGFDSQVIENPKLLIRQTGDRLISAYDDSGLYHLNNVHSLSPRLASNHSLHFIDGLLNSSFWLYLYRLKTREQGRALAQVDIETLESMPLPNRNVTVEEQISALTCLFRTLEKSSQCDIQKRIQNAIDKLVYDMYGLDEEVVKQIERGCGKLSDNQVVLPTAKEILSLQNLAATEEVVCHS
jgi:hypothetical protein